MAAWCELREGFRNVRIDRIQNLEILDERFAEEDGKTLRDYLAGIDPRALRLLGD